MTRSRQTAPLEEQPYESRLLAELERRGLGELVDQVATDHFALPHEIVGRTRRPTPTRARHEVWRRLRDRGFSLNEIGAMFDRDHTTVMIGIRKARARRNGDER